MGKDLSQVRVGFQPIGLGCFNQASTLGLRMWGVDANRNTTSLRGMGLAYSPDNCLTSVTNAAEITQYGYSGAGERIIKLDSANQKTVYHYGFQGQLLAELTASGSLQKAYIYTNGQPVAFVDYSTNGSGDLYYVHNDHLGTPQGLTNEAGAVVWKASYEPFGLATVDGDPDLDGTMVEFNIRFPGQYFDSESQLHYNYFRDYDPNIGRYLQSDPIGLGGGLNSYVYVFSNPIARFDALGLLPGPFSILTHGFRPLTGQTAQEAAIGGQVADSLAAGGITGLDVRSYTAGYVTLGLDTYQLIGGLQTVGLSSTITYGLYGTGATLSTAGGTVLLPGILAGLGGIEIGTGISNLYEDFTGSSIGSDFYDFLNPSKPNCY